MEEFIKTLRSLRTRLCKQLKKAEGDPLKKELNIAIRYLERKIKYLQDWEMNNL